MSKKTAVNILICVMITISGNTYANDRSKVYTVPDDVKCQSVATELLSDEEETSLSPKTTYCTDIKGKPLNGQMIKYHNGIALKRYPMKEGKLHGQGKIYYKNGRLKTVLNYKNGILNGLVMEFDKRGNIIEKVPYVNGKKEGIATYFNEKNISKFIYENDKIQGKARIWDSQTKQKIYDLQLATDKLVAITYYYDAKKECEENCRKEHCKVQCNAQELYACVQECDALEETTKEVKVYPWMVDGINQHCLTLHESLTENPTPVEYTPEENCNQMWLLKNEKRIFTYMGKQAPTGTLVKKAEKLTEKIITADEIENPTPEKVATPAIAEAKKEPVYEQKAEVSQAENINPSCQELGLPGQYQVKDSYQTENKDTVCEVTKDEVQNLLQYSPKKDLLRIWAPQKVCSKAESILNPEQCEITKLLYKFRMGNREIKPQKYEYGIIAGIYSYQDKDGHVENRKIPPLIVEGINQKCLILQSVLSQDICPVIATGSAQNCNQMWRQQHREEIIAYIKECRQKSKNR